MADTTMPAGGGGGSGGPATATMTDSHSPPGEPAPTKRPTFSNFWKRSKEAASAAGTRSLTFVVSGQQEQQQQLNKYSTSNSPEGDEDIETGDTGSAPTKAQIRRAQVRKAQIEHRRRKATYVKQLEDDITETRNLIAAAEAERAQLRSENESIRTQLVAAGVLPAPSLSPSPVASAAGSNALEVITTPVAVTTPIIQIQPSPEFPQQHQQLLQPPSLQLSPPHQPAGESPVSLFDDIDVDNLTVVFSMDDTMGAPSYRIMPSSSSSGAEGSNYPTPSMHVLSPVPIPSPMPHTRGSTPASSPPHVDMHAPPSSAASDAGGAPAAAAAEPVHDGISGLDREQTHQAINFILALEHGCWDHFRPIDFRPGAPPANIIQSTFFLQSGHQLMASALALRSAPPEVFSGMWVNNPSKFVTKSSKTSHLLDGATSWHTSGLTLQNLRGLADSLNPGSDKEVAPVQAWFELAARYPPSLLLRWDVLEALKRELEGVAKCLHFGACMEREAFESVVSRVMGAFTGAGSGTGTGTGTGTASAAAGGRAQGMAQTQAEAMRPAAGGMGMGMNMGMDVGTGGPERMDVDEGDEEYVRGGAAYAAPVSAA